MKKMTSTARQKQIIQIQVIDPQQISLWGICRLIESDARFSVISQSTTGADAIRCAQLNEPDIIVIEPEFDDEDAMTLIDTLLQKTRAKLILLTSNRSLDLQDRAILKGARGVVLKSESPEVFFKALEKVAQGELWLNRNSTSRLLMKAAESNLTEELSDEQIQLGQLTPKEEKVTRAIQLYPKKTLKEVAQTLHISEHTLRNHLASIYDKLSVRNRLELYVFCGKYQKTGDPSNHPKRRASDI
jgi:two-component system nitrate/nitrite response regulator NarL